MTDNQKVTAAEHVAQHLDQQAAEWRSIAANIEADPEWEFPHQSIQWQDATERVEAYTKAAALVREQLV